MEQLECTPVEVDGATFLLCTGVGNLAAAQGDYGGGPIEKQSAACRSRVTVGKGDGLKQKLRAVQFKHPREVLSVEHGTLTVRDQLQIDGTHDNR
eukprot:7386139-Prymnesium_polylepis.1